MSFSGAGQQSVSVASNQFINIFQVDISVDSDTNIDIKIGTTQMFSGNIKETSLPVQLFFYAFGKGRGTGAKGDDLTVQLGAAGTVYVDYILHNDD
jgi:hypothetical protein